VTTAEATVTDEGVAAVEAPQEAGEPQESETEVTGDLDAGAVDAGTADAATADAATSDGAGTGQAAPVATDEGGGEIAAAVGEPTDAGPDSGPDAAEEPSGAGAAATTPIEGYDAWSIAQLRGRLRGYQAKTVSELLDYEEATRAREPYLRMLRNRLQKLDEQAVEASPLAPRGI
jgi:hypothetical protein